MKRTILVVLALAPAVLFDLPAERAVASPPDRLTNYQFIPQASMLHQTGGFAGVDFEMPITGGFGFITGWEMEFPPPTLVRYAEFTNVNAVAHHPIHDFPLPIDDLLNLSGLEGAAVTGGGELWEFNGVDGQGAPMFLRASIHGRIMYLTGANDPGCCDFFQYQIEALAIQRPFADFDSDGDVDGDDFLIWQSNFGLEHPAVLSVPGDADGDQDVDGDDFMIWQREFGTTVGAAAATTVPEPAAGMLVFLLSISTLPVHRLR